MKKNLPNKSLLLTQRPTLLFMHLLSSLLHKNPLQVLCSRARRYCAASSALCCPPSTMVNVIPTLLVVVHVILLAWAAIGMAEWLLPEVPWPLVSNPAFPRWLLLVHWLAVLVGAITFLGGYIARWRATPVVVALAYAFMAMVCVIETFWFLTGVGRFVAMTLEFTAYIGIIVLLRRLPSFVSRFSGRHG